MVQTTVAASMRVPSRARISSRHSMRQLLSEIGSTACTSMETISDFARSNGS